MDATQAIILCAGLQKSYAYEDSKFMFDIAGRPAFSYTMESILEVFPESAVTIITSQRFQDFNAFINQAYPTATVAFDDNPGSGTALSLKSYSFQEAQLAYWAKQLAGPLPVLQLPIAHARSTVQQTFQGKTAYFSINEELTKALKAFAHQEQASLL